MSFAPITLRRFWTMLAYGSTLTGLILIGLVWLTTIYHLRSERTNIEESAIQNASNLAGAFEEHLSRTLNEIDRSIKAIRSSYLRSEADFDLRTWLQNNELFDDKTLQFSIVSKDGFIKFSSIESSTSVGTDLRDREHFQFQAKTEGDPLFISKPVIGRTTGKWSVQLTRRIQNTAGDFNGMIVVSLDPAYLSRFYSSVQLGKNGNVRVIGHDGIIRAMGGANAGSLGRNLTGADLFNNYPARRTGSYYTKSGFSDQVPRLVTFRALNDHPLIISIGLAVDEIFSQFHIKRVIYIAAATVASVIILIVMVVSIRGRAIRERMAFEREVQNKRFDAVLKNMPLGVCMFDADTRLVLANDQYYNMYGMPHSLRGSDIRFADIVLHQKRIGAFAGEPDEFFADIADPTTDGTQKKYLLRLHDGRIISVLRRPLLAGGWVSIHEDTTEQQLAKEDLEQTKRFLNSIIEGVPTPVTVKDAHSGQFILVNQAFETFFGFPRAHIVGRTVFELFPETIAENLAHCDGQTIQSKAKRTDVDIPLHTPSGGNRVVTTTRSVVSDGSGNPQYVIAVIEDRTDAKKADERISYLALHDPLTGLPNRVQLFQRIEESLVEARKGKRIAIHFLDLDHFKNVNDTLGHLVGDELLIQATKRLRLCVRETDMVARLGGDEFAVVQSPVETLDQIATVAERIRRELREPYELGGLRASIDVSIGISQAPRDGTSPVELLKRADLALYEAKEEGRGRIRFFEPAMDIRVQARQKIETDLRSAIYNDEFRLYYEPIINLRTNQIDCIEGLLRWFHPTRGLVSPSEFIPIAEETGLIIPLGEWVIRQACSDAATWPQNVKVAVNLSPIQLSSGNLVDFILDTLHSFGVAPKRLELEITEEVLLRHNRTNLEVLESLREHGIQIAMDDFGTGYSSLNYLRHFTFDRIKIDGSFVADLSPYNELALVIIQSIARLAGVLSVPVTAEGVETIEQLEIIKAAGCSHFQGHLLGVSRPADAITELLLHPSGYVLDTARSSDERPL